jgi:hypothetical protein
MIFGTINCFVQIFSICKHSPQGTVCFYQGISGNDLMYTTEHLDDIKRGLSGLPPIWNLAFFHTFKEFICGAQRI